MIAFGGDDDFLEMIRQRHEAQRVHCVLLDAAQLLTPRQVLQLTMVCDRLSIPVLCYGIRTDFQGEPSTTGVIHGRRSPAPAVSGLSWSRQPFTTPAKIARRREGRGNSVPPTGIEPVT